MRQNRGRNPPVPGIIQVTILLCPVKPECLNLLACAHALLSNQKDTSSDYQDTTYYVEDRGTDATGAGKEGTGIVDDILCKNSNIITEVPMALRS